MSTSSRARRRLPAYGTRFDLGTELRGMVAEVRADGAVHDSEAGTIEAVAALRDLATAQLRRHARRPGGAERVLAEVIATCDEDTLRALVTVLRGRYA